jgi:uncharacterized protein (DUF1697 family)
VKRGGRLEMRYIALLRGINVSGHNSIKMAELKGLFESLEFKSVKTYVQSGNVIFDYEKTDCMILTDQIEKKINEVFGFFIKTFILTVDDLENIVKKNSIAGEPNIEIDKLHITLLTDTPEINKVSSLDLKKDENEKFLIIERYVFLYCPNGYGRTKLNNTMFERKFKTTCTTRNWKTINYLLEISKQVI